VWVFAIKPDGTRKARYTVNGSKEEIDGPSDVYAGVVRKESLRTALYLIASYNMEAEVLDFSSAYLQGNARRPILAIPPDIRGEWKDHVWSITGNIYGLRTAGRVWKEKLHSILATAGLTSLEKDDSIYIHRDGDVFSMVIVYVDDCIFASTSPEWMSKFKEDLGREHKVTFKGDLHDNTFLNIHMMRDREARIITLDVKDYIEDTCNKYLIDKSHADWHEPSKVPTPVALHARAYTPITTKLAHEMALEKEEVAVNSTYPQVVGCINYISMVCRPDIAVAACKLSRHMHRQGKVHITAAKRTLRYLYTTRHDVFVIGGDNLTSNVLKVDTWTDSDWGTDPGDSASYSGAMVRLGTTPVFWKTSKQRAIARSSTEAELYALNTGVRECVWLCMLLQEMGFRVVFPVEVHCDNSGAVYIANGSVTGSLRHVRLNIHYPRDLVEKGIINVSHCPTADMLADGLTKELPKEPFRCSRLKLGMRAHAVTMPT